jgi:hypothetical protein
MGHRLDIASGKNEFDRRLGNFRVQIKLDDEGEHVAAVTASILAPRHLSEHQRSCGIPSTVDIFTPAPDALRLAVSILGQRRMQASRCRPVFRSSELRQTLAHTAREPWA